MCGLVGLCDVFGGLVQFSPRYHQLYEELPTGTEKGTVHPGAHPGRAEKYKPAFFQPQAPHPEGTSQQLTRHRGHIF